jgi:diguanylate cyclase (GGDEF)-like protein
LRRLLLVPVVAVCVIALLASDAFAQETGLFLEDVKVYYLVEAAKHIEWPNDDQLTDFRVAILSSDKDQQAAFREREPAQARGKELRFEYLEDADLNPDQYDLIFIGPRFKRSNTQLFNESSTTLIVVDGSVRREQQMLNLSTVGNQVSLQLNRDNLVKRGFQPSVSLLGFAGTKEDLTEQLRANQQRLGDLVNEVASKETRAEELNAELTVSAANLETARKALSDRENELDEARQQLENLSAQIEESKSEVQDYRVEIETQQALFDSKQLEVQTKQQEVVNRENAIRALELEIDKNQKVLDGQLSQIQQQRSMLAEKSETIDNLRDRMFAILGIVILFSLLVYILLRLNKLRKKANQELETVNARLYELATIDSMTGLFNRRHFLEMAQKELRHQQRVESSVATLMMDLDRFKRINDSFGHAAGDKVIEAVGQLLGKKRREYDLVGRMGGEEYAMLLLDCDEQQTLDIANRICADVARMEIPFDGMRFQVTISIGIGKIMSGDKDIERPLARADKALFQAKEAGRNQVVLWAGKSTA